MKTCCFGLNFKFQSNSDKKSRIVRDQFKFPLFFFCGIFRQGLVNIFNLKFILDYGFYTYKYGDGVI